MAEKTTLLNIKILAETKQARREMAKFANDTRRMFATIGKKGLWGTGSDQGAVQKLQAQTQAHLDKTTRKTQKVVQVERTRAEMLKRNAELMSKISRIKSYNVSQTKMGTQAYQGLIQKNREYLKGLGYTDKELKKINTDLTQAHEKMTRLARAHRQTKAGTAGVEPFSKDRGHRARGAIQALPGEIGTQVTPKNLRNMQKVRDFAGDIKKYATFQIRWFASATTIFAVAGAIAAASRATVEFYQNLKDIQAVTGTSDKDIRLISDAALAVAKTTPIAASQASKMGLKLIQAGLDAEQTAEAMKTVAAVTTVAGEDMQTVAKAVTTAMFAWHMEASEIPKIGNILAGALNYSRLTVEDLGTAFNYLASTSAIMDRSLAETTASLAVLSNMGIRASTIGTGMSQMMNQLIIPSAKFRKELARIGLSANDVNPSMNKMADIIESLTKRGFSATKAMDMLGDRAGRIMAASMVAGADALRDMEQRLVKQGELQRALDKSMEGPIKAMASMRNEIEIAAIQIGAVAVPALTALVKGFKFLFSILRNVTAVISLLTESLGVWVVFAIGSAIPAIALLVKNYTALRAITLANITATTLFSGALSLLSKHPYIVGISLTITALAAIGAYFTNAKEKANELRVAYDELHGTQETHNALLADAEEAHKNLERSIVAIGEAWEKTKRVYVELPFATAAKNSLAIMDAQIGKIGQLEEKVRSLKRETAGLEAARASSEDVFGSSSFFRMLSGLSGADEALAHSVQVGKKITANIGKRRDQAVAALGTSIMGDIGEILKTTSREQVNAAIGVAAMKKDRTFAQRLDEARGGMRRIVEVDMVNLKTAFAKMEGKETFSKGDIAQLAGLYRKAATKQIALEEWANKVQAIERQARSAIKDFTKELEKAINATEKLAGKWADMVSTDPLEKIRKGTEREQEKLIRRAMHYQLEIAKMHEKLTLGLGGPYNAEVKRQLGILDKITLELGKQAELVGKIGKEREQQAAAKRDLEFLSIEDQYRKLEIGQQQKLLDMAKQFSLITPLDALKEEVRIKNQLIDLDIQALRHRKAMIEADKLRGSDKELELARINLQLAKLGESKVTPGDLQTKALALPGAAALVSQELEYEGKKSAMEAEYNLYREHVTKKAELDAWYLFEKQKFELAQTTNQRKMQDIRLKGYSNYSSALVSLLTALSTIQEGRSKSTFEALKIAQIAQATISTYAAANTAMLETPGPYWVKIAAAAAIVTAGLANVANIVSTNFGGAAGGGAASGGGSAESEYKYYSHESSQYGTGWRPGEDLTSSGPIGDTYIVQGDVYAQDSDSFQKKVTTAVQQDIQDNGKTKKVIQDYVRQ